jgi:hypothetical protein
LPTAPIPTQSNGVITRRRKYILLPSIPSKVPPPEQFERLRVELLLLMNILACELLEHQQALDRSVSAREFAATVQETAQKLAEASAGWSTMANTIREHWGVTS